MTPEQTLLLLCAAPYPNERQIEAIRRLADSQLNWPEIIALADRHGIAQLSFHTLQRIEGAALPEAAVREFQARFEWAVRHNLFPTAELVRLVKLLGEAGVPAVPFKGPVLAEKLYGNLALRVFSDLDILIHLADKEQVKALLIADGYREYHHPDSAYQFVKKQPQIILEVHWEAISLGSDWLRKMKNKPLPATLPHLAPRLTTAKLGGKSVPTLSPEDTLLILTIHGSKHWWSRLNWLSDIAALIHIYPALDWDWILEQVDYWQIRRPVFLGLNLAHKHLEITLPESIIGQIRREGQIEKLTEQVESMFFIEQNFYTRYIKRPAYFRNLWDTEEERRMLFRDHLALYLKLFEGLFRKQPASRK